MKGLVWFVCAQQQRMCSIVYHDTAITAAARPLVCSSIHATSHPNHVGRKSCSVRCSLLCVRIVLNYEMISYLRRKSRLVRIRETAGWLQVRTEEEGERGREEGNAAFCPHMSPIPRGLKLERCSIISGILPFQPTTIQATSSKER